MKSILLVFVFSILSCTNSFAAPQTNPDHEAALRGIRAAYEAEQQIHSDISAGRHQKVVKLALTIIVPEGIRELREAGDYEQANRFESEWKKVILPSLDRQLNPLELGDHDPLSPWLANFYQTLLTDTHGLVKSIRVINDINTVNYALGVVLFPNGKWRTHTDYDRIEYRKHFIPFADIATYWISLEACDYYYPQYKELCSYAADKLDFYMGRYVAPELSDELFKLLTKSNIASVDSCKDDTLTEGDFEQQVLQQFPQI